MDHVWVTCASGSVPDSAVVAGYDSDGDTIYVGRAKYGEDLLPAKVVPNKGKAYVSFGGKEIEVDLYDVLTGLRYQWVASSNGDIPPASVKVGCSSDGEFLYAGRGHWQGSLTVGKVHPSHGCLYISYGDEEVKLTEYEVLTQPDQWVAASADSLPEDALEGGYDADGDTIYVGRVFKNGDMIAAKVIPNKGGAYVCWEGEEQKVDSFQVLTGAGFMWTACAHGNITPGAVPVGNTCEGETLYVGRAEYSGSLCVGKVHPSHCCLYIPFGGQEVRIDSYEVLVRI